MSDIVARLRDGIPSQSCDTDSVTFVRCGRGDCACEERLSKEAADEIERLRAGIDVARSALLRIEQGAESARASVTHAMRKLITNGKRDD